MPNKGPSTHADIPDIHIGTQGVLKLLKNIKAHKATGPDGIPGRFLKEYAEELTTMMTTIFQASIHQGQVPSDWKAASIVPIFKKGDKHQASNYRPVSLTSIACKLLEHIIHSHIMKYFNINNILTDNQHSFRSKRSCESQLIITINDIAKGLEAGNQVDIVLLDFSKAFDKVPHQRLYHKLNYYGVRNNILSWITDFLSNRTQTVLLDGNKSSTAEVTSGVPQGTVLGPLLFLTFINDLPEETSSDARLFADDCLLYREIKTSADTEILQRDLTALERWESTWQMAFHPQKCTVNHISTKRHPTQTDYILHGHTLQQESASKYLGVTISSNLKWDRHISNTTSKANRTLGFLRRNLKGCSTKVRSLAYQTMIRPTLQYATTAWNPHTATLKQQLEKVQRRAARFTMRQYQDRDPGSVTKLLTTLGWAPLETRRTKASLIMLYKIRHNLIDIPAQHYLTAGDTRTRNIHKIKVLTATKNQYKYSFFPRTAIQWNRLPTPILSTTTLESFRAALDTLPDAWFQHKQ